MISKNKNKTKSGSSGDLGYYGLYRAKCIDNNDPDNRNRILVHIYNLDGQLSYDKDTHRWVPVLSQFGGVKQMGLFMIPPIHAEGFVIFEEGKYNKPIWMGSFAFASDNVIDKEQSEALGSTVLTKEPTTPPEMKGDPTRIVLKTQYPSLNNPDVENDKNKVENLIVMDESKLELLHINQASYSYDSSGQSSGKPSSSINLGDEGITLSVTDNNNKTNSIELTNSGIQLKVHTGETIKVAPKSINIIGSDRTTVTVGSPSGGSVNINGKEVTVDGQGIMIAPPGTNGGGGCVTNDTVCPFVGLPIHIGSSKVFVGG